jgi:transposase
MLKVEAKAMRDGRIEIITGKERRRRWSVEEKLRIVAEAEAAGARTTEVAARNDVVPSLVFTWRRQVREGRLGAEPAPSFVPVQLISAPTENAVPPPHQAAPSSEPMVDIEIRLADGIRIYVKRETQLPLLRPLIAALRA